MKNLLIVFGTFLVRMVHRLPRPFATWLIRLYLRSFPVRMDEAAEPDIEAYANFSDFFTRKLKPGIRPLEVIDRGVYSPVDGSVSQFGAIDRGRLIQAKNIPYSAEQLCTDAIEPFDRGSFITFYLAPEDYHRVHSPIGGRLLTAVLVGGDAYSVASSYVQSIPDLYIRNRRMCSEWKTAYGRLALVMVGARNVSAIKTAWDWPDGKKRYSGAPLVEKDTLDEIGQFHLGSTVVLLTEFELRWCDGIRLDRSLRLGQPIARAVIPGD